MELDLGFVATIKMTFLIKLVEMRSFSVVVYKHEEIYLAFKYRDVF